MRSFRKKLSSEHITKIRLTFLNSRFIENPEYAIPVFSPKVFEKDSGKNFSKSFSPLSYAFYLIILQRVRRFAHRLLRYLPREEIRRELYVQSAFQHATG